MNYQPSRSITDITVLTEFQKISVLLQQIVAEKLSVLAVAPTKPRDGDVVICDGVNWNPLSDGIKRPIWFDQSTTSWKKFDV